MIRYMARRYYIDRARRKEKTVAMTGKITGKSALGYIVHSADGRSELVNMRDIFEGKQEAIDYHPANEVVDTQMLLF